MTATIWQPNHRQLVSAMICLALPDEAMPNPPFFALGYKLFALELPMIDSRGDRFQVDIHLVNEKLNLSLLLECKTYEGFVGAQQFVRYLATTGQEVVLQTGMTTANQRAHLCDSVFVALPAAESAILALLKEHPDRQCAGIGIVRASSTKVALIHDDLTDPNLSQSLGDGWSVSFNRLNLERLPWEPDCQHWELANVIFQTILAFFVRRQEEFGIDDICMESNDLWQHLTFQQDLMRTRVRDRVRAIRRTALKQWVAKVDTGPREERWRFNRKFSTNRNVLEAYKARHHKYVSILREESRDPRQSDFVKIVPEQMGLPFLDLERP